jgi:hypothetical protein
MTGIGSPVDGIGRLIIAGSAMAMRLLVNGANAAPTMPPRIKRREVGKP